MYQTLLFILFDKPVWKTGAIFFALKLASTGLKNVIETFFESSQFEASR